MKRGNIPYKQMSKIQFKEILERYLSGTCSAQEKKIVEQWYELLDEDYRVLFPNMDMASLEEVIWEKIKPQMAEPVPVVVVRKVWYQSPVKWAWAASLVLLVGIGAWVVLQSPIISPKDGLTSSATLPKAGLVHVDNKGQTQKLVKLPDGTIVKLNAGASIDYPKQWASDKRELFLTGTAFFEVVRNPEQPFLVYANDIVTKVLGTSFWINAQSPDKKVEIAVVTGKVSVFKRDSKADYISANTKSGVILTPNQQVDYFPENQVFVTRIVKEPVLILPDIHHKQVTFNLPTFVYDEQSVATVLDEIGKAYGIEIILENEQINNCPITADLSQSSLYTKLDIICATLKASYEIRGTKILISGKGC